MFIQKLNKKEKLLFRELFEIVEEHDCWSNDRGEEANENAKKALIAFYHKFKQFKPSNEYSAESLGPISHFKYIFYLTKIKKAFKERKYMRAVNELTSLIFYLPFLQRRIYYNILEILEEELFEKEGSAT